MTEKLVVNEKEPAFGQKTPTTMLHSIDRLDQLPWAAQIVVNSLVSQFAFIIFQLHPVCDQSNARP